MRLDRNTKRGKRNALPLQGVVYREVSQVSRDDRFAAIGCMVENCRPCGMQLSVGWKHDTRTARKGQGNFASVANVANVASCQFQLTVPHCGTVLFGAKYASYGRIRGAKVAL